MVSRSSLSWRSACTHYKTWYWYYCLMNILSASHTHDYDAYPRNGQKIFQLEVCAQSSFSTHTSISFGWACTLRPGANSIQFASNGPRIGQGPQWPTQPGAVAEAAYMTGFERSEFTLGLIWITYYYYYFHLFSFYFFWSQIDLKKKKTDAWFFSFLSFITDSDIVEGRNSTSFSFTLSMNETTDSLIDCPQVLHMLQPSVTSKLQRLHNGYVDSYWDSLRLYSTHEPYLLYYSIPTYWGLSKFQFSYSFALNEDPQEAHVDKKMVENWISNLVHWVLWRRHLTTCSR